MEKEEVGKRIKSGRRVYETIYDEKLTQDVLAEKTGLSRSYIGDIESGRTYPTLSALFDISKALQIPIEYFVSENFLLKDYLFNKQPVESAKNEFSGDEIELLTKYRSLSPLARKTVIDLVNGLEDMNKAQYEQSSTKEVG